MILISPSYSAQTEDIEISIEVLKSLGLKVELGDSVFKKWGNFAGTDNQRMGDLQKALDSKHAKAIICIRGGYGISRIIPDLDWTGFTNHPKWIIGFSDVTLLHLKIQKSGFQSIHGLMAARFGHPAYKESFESLKYLLFDRTPVLKHRILQSSQNHPHLHLEGLLTGGNLTLVSHSFGTGFEPNLEGKILVLEETGEPYYKLDRMLHQIKLSGKDKELKAIVLGQFTDCEKAGFPFDLPDLVLNIFPDLPVFYGLEAGHGVPNLPLVLGAMAKIEIGSEVLLVQTL